LLLGMNEGQEFGRRHWMRIVACRFEPAFGGRIGNGRAQIFIQLAYDGVRRADRRDQREPAANFKVWKRFRGGWHVGKVGKPRRRADRKRFDRSGLQRSRKRRVTVDDHGYASNHTIIERLW